MSIHEGPRRSIPLPLSPLVRPLVPPPPITAAPLPSRPTSEAPKSTGRDRRTLHRVVTVLGPSVRVEVRRPDGTRLHGIVEDCCWNGAAVRFGYASDPRIRVDQVGVVVVTSLRLPELTLRARVASAEPITSGGTRYGLQFLDEDELQRQVTPPWRRWFSRRRSPRFEPRDELAASISVRWRGGEARGRVLDVSKAGVGVELDLASARAAVVAHEVGVLLAFPGSGGTMRLRAIVRGAKQGTPSVRVGLELVHDTMYDSCRQRLEAWLARCAAGVRT